MNIITKANLSKIMVLLTFCQKEIPSNPQENHSGDDIVRNSNAFGTTGR